MRTILITGATGSIGQALAKCYANRNTRLVLTGRNTEKLAEITKICEKKGAQVVTEALDICDQDRVIEWISKIDKEYSVDLVIANAGINSTMAAENPAEIHENAYNNFKVTKKVFDTNTYGVLATITPLINGMKRRKAGQIAIISSLAAYRGMPQSGAYCASKAALKVYGESLRAYLSVENIKVSVVFPGYVKSAMSDSLEGPKPFMVSAAKAAKIIKKGLAKNKARIIFPAALNLSARLSLLLPNRLIHFIFRKCMKRKKMVCS